MSLPSEQLLRAIAALFLTMIAFVLLIKTGDSFKKGEKDFPFTSTMSFLCIILILYYLGANGFLGPDKGKQDSASIEAQTSAPEVFDLPDGRTVAAGTMDELMQWIDDNAITHVETLSQLDSRDSLTRWRELRPEGVPSQEVRDLHDRDEFMHYAVIKR